MHDGQSSARSHLALRTSSLMKILVANIGSTSLKWRLFDFSDKAGRLLHKGSLDRVADYSKAIEDCLAQLRDAGAITRESDLAAVGFRLSSRKA
jgi:acetate kinase